MDLEHLRLFLHLSETLHFGRTSRERFVSPPTLTRAIQRLEEECKKPLFVRDRRFVELTPAGREFKAFARETLQRWEELRGSLGEEARVLRGELRLFCSVTASYTVLPEVLPRFRKRHPHVLVRLTTGDANEALDRVATGTTDVAIGALPDGLSENMETREIVRTPLVAIIARTATDLPVRRLERGDPDAWRQIPMIYPAGGILRQRSDAWFAKLGIAPRLNGTVAGHEAILSMVSLGLGAGIIPKIVLERSLFRVRVRILNVAKALPELSVGFYAMKGRLKSPVVAALWAAIDDSQC